METLISSTQWRRRWLHTLAASSVLVIGSSIVVPIASATVGPPVRAGDVVVVDDVNQSEELTHGGSATKFSLRLPEGAACPGDSAHDQWRFQSFIIPAADDPATLRYGAAGPEGPGQYPIFDDLSHPIVDNLLQQNVEPGQPGLIPVLPALDFAVFPPGTLPGGQYRIGIACTFFKREAAMYWDAEIVLAPSPGDKPSELVWRLPGVPDSVNDPAAGTSAWVVLAVGALVGVVAVGGFFLYRTIRRTPTLSKDSP